MNSSSNTKSHGHPGRHLLRGLGVILATAAMLVGVAAAPASADTGQRCTGNVASNVCLAFWPTDADHYRVHVGIDFRIGLANAQRILDQPGDPYRVRIFGVASWPWGNQPMFDVPVTVVVASEEAGLAADFDIPKTKGELNDDPWWLRPFTFTKVFARVDLYDNGNHVATFDSPMFPQNF